VAEVLRPLPGPYELLDLPDRGRVSLKIMTWERGTMIIHPNRGEGPTEKEIEVLRVHLAVGVKDYPPMYYDITSKTLMAQMLPMFYERGYENYTYVITKYGVAPRARFTLERIPGA